MSAPLTRSLARPPLPPQHCERYLQRCARQRIPLAQRDDLRPLLRSASRPFSTCPRRAAATGPRMPKVKQKAQQSITVAQNAQRAQAMGRGVIPDDVGLMENTFIMPTGRNLPGWLGETRARWRLERYRLRARMTEWFQNIYYRFFTVRPRPKLYLRSAAGEAKRLHRAMYAAFAAGDLKPVQGEICSGLLSSLRARIGQRPANTHLRWTLHKYVSKPRLASLKAGVLPGVDGKPNKDRGAQNGFLQAVVRIHSLQSLQHVRTVQARERGTLVRREVLVDAQGREMGDAEGEAGASRDAKETVEYFVIQKQLKRSREGPWMVWGTAEETDLQKVEEKVRRTKLEKVRRTKQEKEAKARGGGGAAAAPSGA